MPLSSNSYAAAVGAAVKNVQFAPSALNVPRKILCIGTFDPAKTAVVENELDLVTSPEDAGDKFGFGFMLHRLVLQAFNGSDGVECWVVPQAETGLAATGSIDFAGPATAPGVIYLYIAGQLVTVSVADTATPTQICSDVVDAINAIKELPVTAAVNGVDDTVADLTSKSKGTWGNFIDVSFNWGFQEVLPAGVTAVITDMSGGTTVPDIDDALNALGTGDESNENYFTDMVHGYLQDSTTFDKISIYNGISNEFTGCYSKTVARPFRSLNGDTEPGSGALTTLLALGNSRKTTDRTNGVIAVPGSPNHPAEIAAVALGIMAKINNDRAAESYVGKILPGIIAGAKADRWCKEYDDRNTAVQAGISPTIVEANAVVMQNVLTFYHPDGVPITSNGYRSMRNISIIQNILYNEKLNFSQEKWQGISIVEDVLKVSNSTDREKARDIDAVIDDLVALAIEFESRAWLYTAAFTIDKLKEGGYVTIRDGGTGFDSRLPVIFSGEGGILDTITQFDTSLAVLLG